MKLPTISAAKYRYLAIGVLSLLGSSVYGSLCWQDVYCNEMCQDSYIATLNQDSLNEGTCEASCDPGDSGCIPGCQETQVEADSDAYGAEQVCLNYPYE